MQSKSSIFKMAMPPCRLIYVLNDTVERADLRSKPDAHLDEIKALPPKKLTAGLKVLDPRHEHQMSLLDFSWRV